MKADYVSRVSYAVMRECLGKWGIGKQVIDFHNIMFIMRGECDLYINGKQHRLRAGDVCYCPYGTLRSAGNSTVDALIYAFDFDLFGTDELPLVPVTHSDELDTFKSLFRDFFSSWYQKNDGFELFCSGIFMMILSKLIYPKGRRTSNRYVKAMKEYIVEHLSETITVTSLAKAVNLSPDYCGTLFSGSEGMTVHEYINTMRINIAKDLINENQLSMSEIAEIIGYSDVFYFCKTFKRIVGVTPTDYRRQSHT